MKRKFDNGGSSWQKRQKRKYRRRAAKRRGLRFRRSKLGRMVKRVVINAHETQHKDSELCSNLTCEHNEMTMIATDLLDITQGDGVSSRMGDRVYIRGVKLKLYFENQQYRPFARYCIVVFRDKVYPHTGKVTGDSLQEGVSTNKNLDFFDFNRYEFKVIKRVNVTMPNSGSSLALSGTVDGVANVESGGASYEIFGNPSKYVNIWVPFNYNVLYQDGGSSAVSTQMWQLGVITYGSFGATTSGATYPIGHVSCVKKLYFKEL